MGKDIEVYTTMSESKAAFAERAIQSLKHIIYRYIEDHFKKFVPKLQQFFSTLNCRYHFLSFSYNKLFMKYT